MTQRSMVAVIAVAGVLLLGWTPFAAAQSAAIAAADRELAAGRVDDAVETVRGLAAEGRGAVVGEALARLMEWTTDGDESFRAASRLVAEFRDHPRAERARELVAHYQAARGAYRTAARLFGDLAASATGEARWRYTLLEGRALLGDGAAAAAGAAFQRVAVATRDETMGGAATLGIGEAAAIEGNLEAAAAALREFLTRFAAHDERPVALGQLAAVLDRSGDATGAAEIRRMIIAEHPASIQTAEARDLLRRQARAEQQEDVVDDGPAARGLYTLQVGAFASQENALELSRQMRDRGLDDVRIELEERDGRQFFRVRVGSYSNPEDAKEGAAELQRRHDITAQIVAR